MKVLILNTTFPSQIEAEAVAKTLVKEKLVACAQIHNTIKSFYLWEDEFKSDTEIATSFKTSMSSKKDLEKRIIEIHSYEIPQLIWREVEVSEQYGEWIEEAKI